MLVVSRVEAAEVVQLAAGAGLEAGDVRVGSA